MTPLEYSALDILEYWIVDPIQNRVTICILDQGRYRDMIYQSGQSLADGNPEQIVSPMFPNLNLTAEQILNAEL